MFEKFINKETLQMEDERLKEFFSEKESEFRDMERRFELSRYSTSELKAEIIRRKNERRWRIVLKPSNFLYVPIKMGIG